jgi:hypothetical protein
MIESILIQIFTPLLINPAFPDSGAAYRSGIDDSQVLSHLIAPNTTHPMLRIDTDLYESEMILLDLAFMLSRLFLSKKRYNYHAWEQKSLPKADNTNYQAQGITNRGCPHRRDRYFRRE